MVQYTTYYFMNHVHLHCYRILKCIVCNVPLQCALVQCTLYCVCILYRVQYILYTVYTVHVHCSVHTIRKCKMKSSLFNPTVQYCTLNIGVCTILYVFKDLLCKMYSQTNFTVLAHAQPQHAHFLRFKKTISPQKN